ncbi:MAG TPA: hypothetical protein GX722_07175 [Clostridiales bacterium]|jgi:epoxyqueuosine reductase|nr:hypothetical protein [Clostridiales bacterium]
MNNSLTLSVKELAYRLGADLVGVANIERFANAPIKMSPQGILPSAKSVIVCAIHHPDAAIELDGEEHPQIMGPYRIQYIMNDKLDVISFKVGRYLSDMGYATVPLASSNIWRYRGYKELDAVFSPDMSHIYAAVCAGLGEVGWNGITMTPEFGARNRFISIITEAELEPTPLYHGEKLCDLCGECIRNCPTDAYRKEVNGTKSIVVEDKECKFCNKNLWRCAWGEHFDIDLDLPIPDVVDEKVLLDAIEKHGARGGEFGVCLKVCLPKHLRNWDKEYSRKSARRIRHVVPTDIPVHRAIYDRILMHANQWDLDSVHFMSAETLKNAGIDIKKALPDGVSAILFTARYPALDGEQQALEGKQVDQGEDTARKARMDILDWYHRIAQYGVDFTELDVCRELEKQGYSALPKTYMSHDAFRAACGVAADDAYDIRTSLVLTSAPLEDKAFSNLSRVQPQDNLTKQIRRIAMAKGADLFGVAPAQRIDQLAEQIKNVRRDEVILSATDLNPRMMAYDPVVTQVKRQIQGASDVLPGAKSVIVLGIHYPETATKRVGKPPAEAVGPYVFSQYEVNRLAGHLGYAVANALVSMGYKALYTHNLTGAGSTVGSPRGQFHDATCNALEAVAAGIGQMALNGSVVTDEYGIHQRFIAIVTDAELDANPVHGGMYDACAECGKCIAACPTAALREADRVNLNVDGAEISWLPVEANRCDWASKYALVSEEGNMYGGNFTNIECPEEITPDALADALRQHDHVFKFRPVTGERCIVVCPLFGDK